MPLLTIGPWRGVIARAVHGSVGRLKRQPRIAIWPAYAIDRKVMRNPPRVVVEPSDYVLRNFGDMAMLRSAVEGLATVLPGATIQVLTDEPEVLRALCPSAVPLAGDSRQQWLNGRSLEAFLNKHAPHRLAKRKQRLSPKPIATFLEGYLGRRSQFVKSVKQADVLVVAGMGGITDYFPEYAYAVLRTMELAVKLNRRVVMVGQGLGPLEDPALRNLAAEVLPKLDLITLREKRASEPLLRALGVSPDRVIVTGDDAVRMAYDLRTAELGSGIGVNLRLTNYSGVDADAARRIGETIRQVASARDAPLVPLPISRPPRASDLETLRIMMPNCADELESASEIASIGDIVRQVQRCRLVITGSYHGAVFALANGIPAVGIAGSSYYVDKFEGLADMFGEGCAEVRLDRRDGLEELRVSVERLWSMTGELRPRLLNSAEEQIASNRTAYDRIANLVLHDGHKRSDGNSTWSG